MHLVVARSKHKGASIIQFVEEAVAVFATGSTMTVRVEVAVRPLLSVAT
jgi:hypothetical protein